MIYSEQENLQSYRDSSRNFWSNGSSSDGSWNDIPTKIHFFWCTTIYCNT